MTTKTAKFIRDVSEHFSGTAKLYKLSPPLSYNNWKDEAVEEKAEYVISSATISFVSGPETLVFPANEDGTIKDWGDIAGGRGYTDCDRALIDAGYTIERDAE